MTYSNLARRQDGLPPSQLLLIEDSDDLQAVLKIGLEIDGLFNVTPVHPRIDWVTMVKHLVPDLILLDVDGKKNDTLTCLELFKKRQHHIPIVCIVSRDRPDDHRRIREHGVVDIIAKPFDLDTLTTVISNTLETTLRPE